MQEQAKARSEKIVEDNYKYNAFNLIRRNLLKNIRTEMSIHYLRRAKLLWGETNITKIMKAISIYKTIYRNYVHKA